MKVALISALALVLLTAVGVGAFFAGENYGLAQAQNVRNEFFQSRFGQNNQGDAGQMTGQFGQRSGQNPSGGAGNLGRVAASGTVKSIQGNTIQLTSRDGSTITVTVDAQTQIQLTSAGSISDIKPGENISVTSEQTGNNIAARVIQIRRGGQ